MSQGARVWGVVLITGRGNVHDHTTVKPQAD